MDELQQKIQAIPHETVREVVNQMLMHGPMTCKEIAAKVGRKLQNIQKTLYRLQADGIVYVSGYQERIYQNCLAPREWSIGNLPDAPRPKPKSNKQKRLDYRKRNYARLMVKDRPSSYVSLGVWRGLL